MTAIKCVWLAIALGTPAGVQAQVTPSTTDVRSPRQVEAPAVIRYKNLTLRLKAGTVVPGSGAAIGGSIGADRLGSLPLGLEVDGRISVRNYQHVAVRLGELTDRRTSVSLDPADSPITSVVDLPDSVSRGRAFYVEQRYRKLPGLSLFGATPADDATRTDFGQKLLTTDVVFQWQGSRSLGVGARVGYLTSTPFSGTNDLFDNTESVFGSSLGPALDTKARYVVAGLGAGIDGRDDRRRPALGTVLNVAVWRFQSRSSALPSFTRASFDARAYRMMWSSRHVLAARILGSYTGLADASELPFQLTHSLGGSRVMRSFPSYRFRGRHVAAATLESRWRVWRVHELVAFVDVGRIDSSPVSLGGKKMFTSTGIGARVWLSERLVLRGDVSTGRDGIRVVGTLGTPF